MLSLYFRVICHVTSFMFSILLSHVTVFDVMSFLLYNSCSVISASVFTVTSSQSLIVVSVSVNSPNLPRLLLHPFLLYLYYYYYAYYQKCAVDFLSMMQCRPLIFKKI